MKINLNNEDHNSIIIAMEIGYQALADLATLYKEINSELLKQLAIFEGKSVKEVKKQINTSLSLESREKEYLSKINASQEVIKRYNKSLKKE